MEEHLRPDRIVGGHIVSHAIRPDVQESQGHVGQRIPIAPISSLSQAAITTVYTLPPDVDVERLKKAIARTIGIWRITCGRLGGRELRNSQTELWFTLTDSPVHLDVQTFSDTDEIPPLPDSKVLQPLSILNPFLTLLPASFSTPDSDTSLVTFRLTLLPSRSLLGIQFSHLFGDGAAFLHFITHLSDMYADPSHTVRLEDYPVFEPHVGPLPELSEVTMQRHRIPTMNKVPIAEAVAIYTDAAQRFEPFTFVLSRKKAEILKSIVGASGSAQDAMSAFFVLLLRKLGRSVEHLVYILNYRTWHPNYPSFPPTLARLSANVSQMYGFDLPPNGNLREISIAIRHALLGIRNSPERCLEWLSACSTIAGDASESRMAIVIPPDGWAAVNASYSFNFNVGFGFPATETTYHTSWSGPAFLRVFKANPPCAPGDAELTFDIEKGSQTSAMTAVAELEALFGIAKL